MEKIPILTMLDDANKALFELYYNTDESVRICDMKYVFMNFVRTNLATIS